MAAASSDSNKSGDWTEIQGKDVLLKITETRPTKEPKPVQRGDSVLISFTGRQLSTNDPPPSFCPNEDGPVFQQVEDWLVQLGNTDLLVPCLDMALLNMKEGETALIWSTPEHANIGNRIYKQPNNNEKNNTAAVPVDANVLYEITLTMKVMDTSQVNPYFAIQTALTRKHIANDLYQHEWALPASRQRCLRLYQQAASDMHTLLHEGVYFQNVATDPNHPQREQYRHLWLDCSNNVTAVYMRAKSWSAARQSIIFVLQQDPNNVKAHLRHAKVALALVHGNGMTLQEANAVLQQAESVITYRDRAEQAELRKLRAQWAKKQKQAALQAAAAVQQCSRRSASSAGNNNHDRIAQRYRALRKEGLDAREAMAQARRELAPPDDDEPSPTAQVAAMFGLQKIV